MEIIFVYSLVFLFLAGFALFSVLILATHPDREERRPVPGYLAAPVSPKERVIAYSIVAALLLFFLFLALQRRELYYHSRLDIRSQYEDEKEEKDGKFLSHLHQLTVNGLRCASLF